MTVSDDLLFMILSMDAYNRGYGEGLKVKDQPSGIGAQIGNATLFEQRANQTAQSADFYAAAYRLADGQEIIAYRGTDNYFGDIWNGWSVGAGFAGGSQADLAMEFYKSVAGVSSIYGGAPNIILIGHSLGGGLAGLVSTLSGTQGVGFNYMPFGLAAISQYAADSVADPQNATAPDWSAFRGPVVDGEILEYVRSGLLQSALGDSLILTAIMALGSTHPVALAINALAQGVGVSLSGSAPITSLLDQQISKNELKTFGFD